MVNMMLNDLNAESRTVAEQLFLRFPTMTEYAKIYVPINDFDRESDAGSLFIEFPIAAESGLECITIHHRGDCFEIGCYYNGKKLPEEFQLMDISENKWVRDTSIADFVEQLINLPPNSLKGKTSIRKILGY